VPVINSSNLHPDLLAQNYRLQENVARLHEENLALKADQVEAALKLTEALERLRAHVSRS
jgi:hypothetical protein